MKKIYLPLVLDKTNHKINAVGVTFFPMDGDALQGYFDRDMAMQEAKELNMKSPSAKVVILESIILIEPRKIEFAEKKYNGSGELVI